MKYRATRSDVPTRDHWGDARYELLLTLSHPKTGQPRRLYQGQLDARRLRNPLHGFEKSERARLPRSVTEHFRLVEARLFDLPRGRCSLAVQWLCQRALIQRWAEPIAREIPAFSAHTLRRLHGMTQKAKRMVINLKAMQEIAERLETEPLLHDFYISGYLSKAVAALEKFAKRAKGEPSQTANLKFERTEISFFWPFRPPALAYGLYKLLRKNENGVLRADDAYDRINGRFWVSAED